MTPSRSEPEEDAAVALETVADGFVMTTATTRANARPSVTGRTRCAAQVSIHASRRGRCAIKRSAKRGSGSITVRRSRSARRKAASWSFMIRPPAARGACDALGTPAP